MNVPSTLFDPNLLVEGGDRTFVAVAAATIGIVLVMIVALVLFFYTSLGGYLSQLCGSNESLEEQFAWSHRHAGASGVSGAAAAPASDDAARRTMLRVATVSASAPASAPLDTKEIAMCTRTPTPEGSREGSRHGSFSGLPPSSHMRLYGNG